MLTRKFHLIHGTWSRNADWTQAHLSFCKLLKAKLGARDEEFQPLEWWGLNQVFSRDAAAKELQRKILTEPDDVQHYLIAHSHGGNVAMYAIRDESVRRRVKGIVCMSTPFLHVDDRPLRRPLLFICAAVSLVWCAAVALSCCHAVRHLWGMPQGPSLNGHHVARFFFGCLLWFGWLLIAVGLAAAAALLACAAVLPFQMGKRVLRKAELPQVPPCDLLLIRAVGDEASAALATARFADWLVGIVLRMPRSVSEAAAHPIVDLRDSWAAWTRYLGRLLLRSPIALLPTALISSVLAYAVPKAEFFFVVVALAAVGVEALIFVLFISFAETLGYLRAAVVASWALAEVVQVVCALIAPLLVVLLAASAGVELAIAAFRVQLSAEATPPGCASVHLFPVLPPPSGDDPAVFSSHCGIYERKDAQELIAGWLLEKCKSAGHPSADNLAATPVRGA